MAVAVGVNVGVAVAVPVLVGVAVGAVQFTTSFGRLAAVVASLVLAVTR